MVSDLEGQVTVFVDAPLQLMEMLRLDVARQADEGAELLMGGLCVRHLKDGELGIDFMGAEKPVLDAPPEGRDLRIAAGRRAGFDGFGIEAAGAVANQAEWRS
ncbi:hypothetical protein DBA20_11120 [Pandoraea capi]|nr:hypothetical protein [Pandoraea sp. LA3]MDN4583536.1 hypothetical protein [Pandoraea capi]